MLENKPETANYRSNTAALGIINGNIYHLPVVKYGTGRQLRHRIAIFGGLDMFFGIFGIGIVIGIGRQLCKGGITNIRVLRVS
ncbi:MAG: hypothetical protein GY757_07725 [bacterium]|nr:hypothetical protein [bacterium]